MAKIPQILLAAGASKRMGKPKQLLPWGDVTLIEHQISTLVATGQPVLVVLGANAQVIGEVIENYPVTLVNHKHWKKGMGSSIAYGMQQLQTTYGTYDGVLLSLVDQPLVSISHLQKMIAAFTPGAKQIIASTSASGWQGVPVLFDACYFNELMALQGEEGAKKIVRNNNDVTYVDAGNTLIDLDKKEDYLRFKP